MNLRTWSPYALCCVFRHFLFYITVNVFKATFICTSKIFEEGYLGLGFIYNVLFLSCLYRG